MEAKKVPFTEKTKYDMFSFFDFSFVFHFNFVAVILKNWKFCGFGLLLLRIVNAILSFIFLMQISLAVGKRFFFFFEKLKQFRFQRVILLIWRLTTNCCQIKLIPCTLCCFQKQLCVCRFLILRLKPSSSESSFSQKSWPRCHILCNINNDFWPSKVVITNRNFKSFFFFFWDCTLPPYQRGYTISSSATLSSCTSDDCTSGTVTGVTCGLGFVESTISVTQCTTSATNAILTGCTVDTSKSWKFLKKNDLFFFFETVSKTTSFSIFKARKLLRLCCTRWFTHDGRQWKWMCLPFYLSNKRTHRARNQTFCFEKWDYNTKSFLHVCNFKTQKWSIFIHVDLFSKKLDLQVYYDFDRYVKDLMYLKMIFTNRTENFSAALMSVSQIQTYEWGKLLRYLYDIWVSEERNFVLIYANIVLHEIASFSTGSPSLWLHTKRVSSNNTKINMEIMQIKLVMV